MLYKYIYIYSLASNVNLVTHYAKGTLSLSYCLSCL